MPQLLSLQVSKHVVEVSNHAGEVLNHDSQLLKTTYSPEKQRQTTETVFSHYSPLKPPEKRIKRVCHFVKLVCHIERSLEPGENPPSVCHIERSLELAEKNRSKCRQTTHSQPTNSATSPSPFRSKHFLGGTALH